MDGGGLCVMTFGIPQTLVWLVVNLDFLEAVPAGPQVALEGETFCTLQSMTFPEATKQFKYMQPLARVEFHRDERTISYH